MKQVSDWLGEGGGFDPPDCPHCGDPVRSADAPKEAMFPGAANLPWNSGWDGSCESCGVTFAHRVVSYGTYQVNTDGYSQGSIGEPGEAKPGFMGKPDTRAAAERFLPGRPFREVRARPKNVRLVTFVDEAVVFATVEVTVEQADFGKEPVAQTITLTVDELRAIMDGLEGPLAPITKQWGWRIDNT